VSERRDRFDAELSELFGEDPDLLQLAQVVRESRPEPVLDPRFPPILRARLMDEARTVLAPRHTFRTGRAPRRLAIWGGIGAAAALAAAAAVVVALTGGTPPPGGLAVVASNVSHQQAVDPHQAITLSFNEPLSSQSEAAVVNALKIQPATQVTVAWESAETLVVTPTHPLAADTDYQVTIPKAAILSTSGQTLASNVTIEFGTQAVAAPGPTASPVPALEPAAVGPAAGDGLAFWGPHDAPGVTDSTAGQPTQVLTPSASPGPSASTSPASTATPHSSAAGSPSASPLTATPSPSNAATTAPTPSPVEGAVYFPADQAPVPLSDLPSSAVAVSPDGLYVALAVSQPDGTSAIVIENPDGSSASRVWPSGSAGGALVTTLAWDGSNRIVFVTPGGIYAVDLDDHWSQLYAFPAGGSASGVVLAADGQAAFLPAADVAGQAGPGATASPSASATSSAPASSSTPASSTTPSGAASPTASSPSATPAATHMPTAGDGWLVTLPTDGGQVPAPTQLAGSVSGVVTFSATGDEVAWVDVSGSTSTVVEAPAGDPTTITPIPGAPTEGIEELALDAHGATIAYELDPGGIEVETASGTVLGTTPDEASSVAFSTDGTRLAFVAAGSLDVAQVQTASAPPGATSLCEDAGQVLTQFVGDQVAHDLADMATLSSPGAPPAGTLTPSSIDRGYVISSSCTAASANSGPTLTASARLIADPTPTSPGQITDETILLGESDGGWLVTGLTVPPLHTQGSGPHVLSVSATPPVSGSVNPESVVTVTFDSDLEASSVGTASLWLVTSAGQTLALVSPPSYDPDTREATLIVSGSLPAGTEVVVGTGIADIDGGHPAVNAIYPVGG
jgi:methionine-rich copper-binding protein CopC